MISTKLSEELFRLLEATLRFEYAWGGVTRVEPPHSTGWRVVSEAVCATISGGENRLDIDNEPSSLMHSGEAFLTPPGVRHCASSHSGSPSISRWAHFRVTVFNNVDAFRFFATPRVWRGAPAAQMGQICEALAALPERLAAGDSAPVALLARRKYLGFQLFTLIAEGSRPREGAGLLLDALHRLAPVLERLDTVPGTPLRLAAMARLACLSPSRFSALFRKALGMPPAAYQRQQRLNRAKSQLVHTDKPVAQIAREAGFPDPFHFSKTFRQAAGLAPRAYRAHLRQGMW